MLIIILLYLLYKHQKEYFTRNPIFLDEDLLTSDKMVSDGIYFKYLKLFKEKSLIQKPWMPNFILFSLLIMIAFIMSYYLDLININYLPILFFLIISKPDFLSADDYRMQFFNIHIFFIYPIV